MNFEQEKNDLIRKRLELHENVEREKAGHKAEREVFDEVNIAGYENSVKQETGKFGEKNLSEEVMFKVYRDAVKSNQPFNDPTNPVEKRFPLDLHAKVVEMLKLERYEQLRFYTAVGTDLDKKYGTDAFLELDLGDGKTIDVMLDITLKPEHATKNKYKADVILDSWKKIKYENDSLDDSEDIKMKKKAERKEWDTRTLVFAGMVSETFKEKAEKEKVKIRTLSLEEIESSKEQAKTGLKRQVKNEGAVVSARRERLERRKDRWQAV